MHNACYEGGCLGRHDCGVSPCSDKTRWVDPNPYESELSIPILKGLGI